MLIDTSIDHHVHTRLCNHGTGEMEEYVLSAIGQGLSSIQFLEHLEEEVSYFEVTWLSDKDFTYYFREGKRLQEQYQHQIDIRLGVEVGYNPNAVKNILARINAFPFTGVGISCHFIANSDEPHDLNLFSRKEQNLSAIEKYGRNKALTNYFKHLIEAVEEIPGTMVCHLDGALRHLPNLVLTEEHQGLIDHLLKVISRKQMMLEINTSGIKLRQEPFPAQWIVKRAMEYGIQLAASSDAHKPSDVGRYFDQLPSYIATCSLS